MRGNCPNGRYSSVTPQIASNFFDRFTGISELIENEVKCDFVDLNLGCPIDLICDKSVGAALMLRKRGLKDCLIPIVRSAIMIHGRSHLQ